MRACEREREQKRETGHTDGHTLARAGAAPFVVFLALLAASFELATALSAAPPADASLTLAPSSPLA